MCSVLSSLTPATCEQRPHLLRNVHNCNNTTPSLLQTEPETGCGLDADDGGALRMLVLGTAGTGKSWLVYALSNLLGDHVRRAAPTGMAAFLIGGSTLHSLLSLPVRDRKDLQGDSLKKLQARLAGVKYIIIDELSTVSQVQMAWIDRRLRQATGKTTEPFGGIHGHDGGLRAVAAGWRQTPVYTRTQGPAQPGGLPGLPAVHRSLHPRQTAAGAVDVRQQGFIDLLPRARDGELTQDNWNLLERDPSRQTTETKADFEDATRLFYSKSEVNDYNGKKG